MRGSYFGDLVDPQPWITNRLLLPPQSIKRAYQLEERIEETADASMSDQMLMRDIRIQFSEEVKHAEPVRVVSPKDCEAFLIAMQVARKLCASRGLVPLYHYTTPPEGPSLLERGILLSTDQDGLCFSTMGPASYGLGSPEYERNVLTEYFGGGALEECRGKHKIDLCVVYGADPSVLQQEPGGRDNSKMVSKQTFEDLSLPHADGNYYLRPDRILAAFLLDPDHPPRGYEEVAGELDSERERDLKTKGVLESPPTPRGNDGGRVLSSKNLAAEVTGDGGAENIDWTAAFTDIADNGGILGVEDGKGPISMRMRERINTRRRAELAPARFPGARGVVEMTAKASVGPGSAL